LIGHSCHCELPPTFYQCFNSEMNLYLEIGYFETKVLVYGGPNFVSLKTE